MIANDQHQPASSRAIAMFATAGRFFRSVNFIHWWCSRSLPAWPRRRASTGAFSHRLCSTDLTEGR